ncbi:MAG: DUF6056 family protein [Oscillospiraceae bacterium]|nr:DUF6056 family protein [Oscillospiraceae bacterium]
MADKKLQIGSAGKILRRIALGGTFAASLGICGLMTFMQSDDFIYLSLASQSSWFFEFILGYLNVMRDGRIATAASLWLVYSNNIWLWRICNAAVIALFCFLVCKIACLIAGEKRPRLLPQVFVCASLAIVNIFTVALPVFTVCFSVHYLWACTAAMLALYYPVKEAFFPEENKAGALPYCLIASSVYACLAQEQAAAVVVALLLIITVYRHNEYKKQMRVRGESGNEEEARKPLFLYIQTALSLVGFMLNLALSLLRNRDYKMTSDGRQGAVRLNDFQPYEYSVEGTRVFRTLQWLVYNYIGYAKYVFVLLWVLLFMRFVRKKQTAYAVLCALFAAMAILSVFLPAFADVGLFSEGPSFLVQSTQDPLISGSLSAVHFIVMFWWLFAIGVTPVLLLKALKGDPMHTPLLLLYLAGGACACLMAATNTMYLTMGRTFFVTAILLVMIVASLIPSSIKKPKHMLIAACVIMLAAAAQLRENIPALAAAAKEFFSEFAPY